MALERYPPEVVRAAFERARGPFGGLFPDHRPIFVLGPARSGTTIVGDALRLGAGIPGFHEGFLFTTAYQFLSALDERWDLIGPAIEHFGRDGAESESSRRALSRFDYDTFRAHVLRHFHELSTAGGEITWVAKTPDILMVHAVPMLAAAYPGARFVFVRRHGIDVIASRLRTHPEMTFTESCRDWAAIMLDWRSVRRFLGGRSFDVEQHEIARAPHTVAATLGRWLEFDEEQSEGIARVFTTRFPARTSARDLATPTLLSDTGWSVEQAEAFRIECGAAMDAYGYVF